MVLSSIIKPRKFTQQSLAIIDEASRIIFGNRPVVPYRTDFKLLKRKLIGPIISNYYLPTFENDFRKVDPTFKSEIQERRAEKLIRLRSRNKGPPKKGQGSRAKKSKGKK
mmetsp:Transcript_22946/g.23597  ORF Transcript_22946/g.23597 Transcript_22946/m.23597 type:complete len:110 (+) Transcript_22946:89-418(+)